jgi:hypothetical protein
MYEGITVVGRFDDQNIDSYEAKLHRNSIRNIWQSFIRNAIYEYGPYRFFVTLSFQYTMSKWQAKEFAAQITRDVIKAITGKHEKKRNKKMPLDGVAVLEMAKLFKKGSEGGHFHFLIKDHPDLAKLSDEDAVIAIEKAFKDAASRIKLCNQYHRGRRVVESTVLVNREHGVDVEIVFDNYGVADYVSKESRKSDWDIQERFFYLDLQESGSGLSTSKPKLRSVKK